VTATRLRLGRAAEDEAARRLAAAGFAIVERNARVRYAEWGIAGELDIVAVDRRALVFVEVKAGRFRGVSRTADQRGNTRRAGPERPALAVGQAKQMRLRRLARAWLASNAGAVRFSAIRFDVIGVVMDSGGRVRDYEHIRGAF
jgi:putative endonuclease